MAGRGLFTDRQAQKIIDDIAAGRCTQAEAAALHQVSPATISNLVRGHTYPDLQRGPTGLTDERRWYGLPEVPERRRAGVAAFWDQTARSGDNECWPFRSAAPGEYGQAAPALVGSPSAHVVAYTLANGLPSRPPRGRVIRHLCNNRPCCNPAHLLEGTDAENKQDRFRAERAGLVGPIEVTDPVRPPEGGWIIEVGNVAELEQLARIAEFWSQVDQAGGPDACWPWTGKTMHSSGYYGQMRWDGRNAVPAHRIAYVLRYKMELSDLSPAQHVRHLCPGGANSLCCNPDHLKIGTAAENRADTVADGRVPRGEQHHAAQISDADIAALRHAYWSVAEDKRPKLTDLAQQYDVSVSTIGNWLEGTSRLDAGGPIGQLPVKRFLNAELALEIRHRHHDGQESITSLAAAYGVDRETIADALKGRSFADAGGPLGVRPQRRGMSEKTVLEIRHAVADGETVREVAARLGVSEDAVRKTASGRTHPSVGGPITRAQLTDAQARAIRQRHAQGESRATLAEAFSRSPATIDDVLAGRTHADAGGPLTEVMPRGQWRRDA
ncbi:HNH endonuclease [Frankia sp. AiPs1]|uniref:HNH endonuclease n=1 Tax=Frankia sp. AiPs1 TaxID=573493 RepID=UPI002043F813|nr:HNH endonuclease [Frankia sp. AiPs1]MCM3920122.1 HNH endonuclease [Frankia sp. AiPs1]